MAMGEFDPRWPDIYRDVQSVFEKSFGYRPSEGTPGDILVRSTSEVILAQLRFVEALPSLSLQVAAQCAVVDMCVYLPTTNVEVRVY